MTPSKAKALDLSAVGLSALCLVHCLALPGLALLLPVLGFWAQAEWVHVAFILAAAPVAVLAFVDLKTWRPRSRPMIVVASAGLALMLAGALEFPVAGYERPLTVLGGLLLAGAHIASWRRRGHVCQAC
uniref:MerC domain-containing protein n=1 Tax=uncultured Caulobacter sp. TaxID=158749 RepID=UPI0025CBFA55|nr:MerC domain-containing protein [uncultured Caulobacter sp.]